jgi:hypothetical protein
MEIYKVGVARGGRIEWGWELVEARRAERVRRLAIFIESTTGLLVSG